MSKKEKQPGKRAIIAAQKQIQRDRIAQAQAAIKAALSATRVPARIMDAGVQDVIAWKDALVSAQQLYHLHCAPSKRMTAEKLGIVADNLESVLAQVA